MAARRGPYARLVGVWVFSSLWVLIACGPREVALLELHASAGLIELGVVERGAMLELSGRGFPAGERGVARFEGVLHAPGRAPARVEGAASLRALTAERLELPADGVISALGARGTFDGRLRVEFVSADAAVRLLGEQPVTLDLAGSRSTDQHALRQRASALLDQLGLELASDAATHDGLVVSAVRANTSASDAGLLAGDVIERASGVRVHGVSDLLAPPLARALELRVRRSATSAPLLVSLPLDAQALRSPLPLGRLSVLLAWALALALVFAARPSPAGRVFATLRAVLRAALERPDLERERRVSSSGGSERTLLGIFGGQAPAPERRHLRALACLLASLLGVLLVCFEPAGFLSVRSLTLYLPLVATSCALVLMQRGLSTRERLASALSILGSTLAMGIVLACACALAGTRAFDGIVAPQGAAPQHWGVFQHPALLLALPAFLVAGARIGDAPSTVAHDEPTTRARKLFDRASELERVLSNVVLAALGAAIFLGGWQSPVWLELGPWPSRLPGALLFVLKSWGVAMLLCGVRRARLRTGARALAALCVGVLLLTGAEVVLAPPAGVTRWLGETVALAVLLTVALLATTTLLTRPARGATALAVSARLE